MVRMSFSFTKKEAMKYISHLDLMRLLIRALRRAEVPVKMTEGFNPHPKLSMIRALKLGSESENEEASITLRVTMSPEKFRESLNRQLPEGIQIKDAQRNIY